MREVETDNSVIWPSWCYNTGENRIDTESLKSRAVAKSPVNSKKKKKRLPAASPEKRMNGLASVSLENRSPTLSVFTNASTTTTAVTTCTTTSSIKMEVKTERLSPSSAITDNNSSGSGSNTPSSSYPETPPGTSSHNDRVPSPSVSPATSLSHPKMMEQPLARNYSDIMRSLAAKYNNSNPNDYYSSSKNGLSFGDPRFSSFKTNALPSTFASLVGPLTPGSSSPPATLNSSCHLNMTTSNTKDANDNTDLKHILNSNDPQNSLFSSFGLGSFNAGTIPSVNLPLFSPLGDMNSTQALLNMVRTANSGSVNQLENYMKGTATKRPPDIVINNPLDLSSNAPLCKKPKRSSTSSECFGSENAVPTSQKAGKDRAAQKSPGNVSPKPFTKSVFTVPSTQSQDRTTTCLSICTSSLDRACSSREGIENVSHWSIDDVCNFVSSIDVCAEYAENFREQSIDGISLPLLTEDHLRTTINMKLGPALKFRALLAQKIGHCTVCMHCLHCHNSGNSGHTLTSMPNSSPSHSTVRPNSTGN